MVFARSARTILGRLYGEPAKTGSSPQSVVPAPRAAAIDGEKNSLKTRLAAAVGGRDIIAAGSFHLVGLAAIKERLGADWERVREKVHEQTRRVIERHISPRDVYFAGGVDDYVLVFAELGKNAAQLVCAKITQEVQQALLGDSDTCEIGVRTVVSETDGSLRLEKTKLTDLVASAAIEASTGTATRTDAEAPETAARAAAMPPPAARTFSEAEIVYRPVWDVRREVLSTYLSRRIASLAPPPGTATPEELAHIDLVALRAGTETLADLHQNKFRLRLSFPVHFEAVASVPRFRTYVELCRTIPEHVRKLVAFELIDLPIGVLHGRLAELTAAFRSYCGIIVATVDWWRADLSQFTNTGIRLVNAAIAPGSNESRTLADMDRFARAAARAGLQSGVEGVGTSSLALAAKGAGIDFISGDRVGPCVEVPNHMLRITWSELYFGKPRAG